MAQVDAEQVALIAAGGTAVGALIGATAGGAVDFVLTRARARTEAKVGARLVMADLLLAAIFLKNAEGQMNVSTYYRLAQPAWALYRETLAAALDGDQYGEVYQAVVRLDGSFHGLVRRSRR